MKRIITLVALATLISAPAFAKNYRTDHRAAQENSQYTSTGTTSDFQSEWNTGY